MQNPFQGAFGLDIGDQSLKLVKLGVRRRLGFENGIKLQRFLEIEELREMNLPSGCVVNGEIVQPDALRSTLLAITGATGDKFKKARSPWVVIDLPEPKTFLKLIDISSAGEPSKEEVELQAKKHLPFELEEAYLDWEIISANAGAKTYKVLLGAVPKIISDSYANMLDSVGLQPIALEIEALSIARAMVTQTKDYTGVARAILDLGAIRSSLVIYDKNTIQFSTNLSFSGNQLTIDIATGLKIDYEEAEKLKREIGLVYDSRYPNYLQNITKNTDKLISEIQSAITFYRDHFRESNPITHITMCGGTARLKELDQEIARKLKISARPGNAWKNLQNKRFTESNRSAGLSWSSAVGLALRAINYSA